MIKNLEVFMTDKIKNAKKVIIVPHNNIDFDAIGSAIGISLIAKKFKRKYKIIVNDSKVTMDPGVRMILNEIQNEHFIIDRKTYLDEKNDDDLFILTDVNKKNLISIPDLITNMENAIIIDHHNEDNNTLDAAFKYIDPNVSSASEIVTNLLIKSRVLIPANVANYLLAGIHLDTKGLTKNTTSNTHKIISKLMESGASNNAISSYFIEDFDKDILIQDLVKTSQLQKYAIRVILANDNDIIEIVSLAKAADYLLKYDLDGSFVVGRIDENTIYISARSKGRIDVGSVMKEFGGGGHIYSGAARIENSSVQDVGVKLKQLLKYPYSV